MKLIEKSIIRVRLNESEVRALIMVLDETKPNRISDVRGERQGLATFRAKLTPAYKKLK